MALGVHRTNATLSAPGYGERKLIVTGLGYGKNIISDSVEARRFKAFYPQVATSGEWFINALFRSHTEMTSFGFWLVGYYNGLIDPNATPLLPMTVQVQSRGFHKVGYPVAPVDFGDRFDQVLYPLKINFMSASDPTSSPIDASKYIPPLRDSAVGATFAPSGLQDAGYVPSPFSTSGGATAGFKS